MQSKVQDNPIYNHWKTKTIAIADDEEYNIFLLQVLLKKFDITVHSFSNGIEIVDYILKNETNKVDLILMDIKMPGMDGFSATRLIKEKFPGLPIIAQTAYAMKDDILKIKAANFDDYITKPIKQELLIAKLDTFLRI